MKTSSKVFYGTVLASALGCGITRGIFSEKGIDLPTGVNPLLMYGVPFVGAVGGFIKESSLCDRVGPSGPADIISVGLGIGAGAVTGLSAVVCEAIGYGAGYLIGKLS